MIVNACCTLHNICEKQCELFDQMWLINNMDDQVPSPPDRDVCNQDVECSRSIRNAFKEYFASENCCYHSARLDTVFTMLLLCQFLHITSQDDK